jgi:hypothetical protein
VLDWKTLLEHTWQHCAPQSVLLMVGITAIPLAVIGRRLGWKSSKWLATVGIAAPIAAFGFTLFDLAMTYRRILAIHGLADSVTPPAPLDQKGNAIAQQAPWLRDVIGVAVGLIMPIAAWVYGRVHWPEKQHRGLRWLALVAAAVVTMTIWGIHSWTVEFMVPVFRNYYDCGPQDGWSVFHETRATLEQVRTRVIGAGVLLGALAAGYGAVQAFRGRILRMDGWVPLFAFVSLAALAKLATSEERRDTRADFPWPQQIDRHGWGVLKGHANDPHEGPALDHCTFDWTGMRVLVMNGPYPDPEMRENWGEHIDSCIAAEGIGPILAPPELAMTEVIPSLVSAHAHGHHRFGVASVRPIPTTRPTTGEFLHLQLCVVEFAIADDGIPLMQFATWGEFATVADAAEGTLEVALPLYPELLRPVPEPVPEPDEDRVSSWAPYRALPDRCDLEDGC